VPSDVFAPEGWTETTLGSLGRYLNGRAFKTSEWAKTGRPIIRIQDLTGSNRSPNYFQGEVEDRYVVRPGDLLISWSATLGAYIWDGPEAVLNQHIFKVESKINKRFHYHLVRERIAELERNAHGSGMVHVTKGIFDETPVAIPEDEALQEQLAGVIDAADLKQQSAVQHLLSARRAIERLRQAVLAAACSGRLTADWRDSAMVEESAFELLEHIDRIRRDGLGRKYRAPSAPEESDLWPIPGAWEWATPEQLRQPDRALTYGVIKLGEPVADGVPTLRSSDVRPLYIDAQAVKRISPTISANYQRTVLEGGELVVTVRGSLGGIAVVPRHMAGWNVSREVAVIPLVDTVNPQFFAYAVASAQCQRWLAGKAKGVAYTGVNIEDLKNLPVPLPPRPEQNEIVRRVDLLLPVADQVEKRVVSAMRRAGRTSQAVLAKAFRGELLPIDAEAQGEDQ
jgi:type I restriction enzyme, S subunit